MLFRTLARDRPHPEMACPANSLPSVSPRSLCLIFARILPGGAIDYRSFFYKFRSIFCRFGSFFAFGGPSASILNKTCEKVRSGGRASLSKCQFLVIFGTWPEPQNRPKTGLGPKTCLRRQRRNRFFTFSRAVVLRCRCRD